MHLLVSNHRICDNYSLSTQQAVSMWQTFVNTSGCTKLLKKVVATISSFGEGKMLQYVYCMGSAVLLRFALRPLL